MRSSNNMLRGLALTVALVLLAGCSEYLDRREAVSANAGNAMAANRVTLMVDPWPRASADKNIRFNGQRMQAAVARYRTNRVTEPGASGTSAAYGAPKAPPTAGEGNVPKPVGPTITQ